MPYYTYTISSSNTWTIFPAVTTGSITAAQTTYGTFVQPVYQWNITSGTYTLEPGWSWDWRRPEILQPAYQPPSREELDAMAAEEQQRQAARARVAGRAEALLASLLDEDQFRSYLQAGWFEVTGSAGGRYRIRRDGQAGNIDELPAQGDQRVASLCIHPYGGFHDADAHAAQYLALVTDEPGFRRTANRTPRRRLQAA
jgi:hypothetical protein